MAAGIIDFHQHVPPDNELDDRIAVCRRAGIEKAILLGAPASHEPDNNDRVMAAVRAAPDLFVPFYGVSMDSADPDAIDRALDRGFRGLKFIGPERAYNDPTYFPVYERAAELRLPVLFHLGIVANNDRWRYCDSSLMRGVHLDHIARRLPELIVVGAHFGNPWSEEAAMACRWNPNLFLDFSGSLLKYRSPQFIGDLLWWRPEGPYASPDKSHAWSKIVFGSDVANDMIEDVIRDYARLMDALSLDETLREKIWRSTAAKLLQGA